MSRMKRILLAFVLVFAVSMGSPAILPNTMQTVQAHGHHSSHHHSSYRTKKAKMVYITDDYYHTHKCGGGTYSRCTLKKAKSYGLHKCKTCY